MPFSTDLWYCFIKQTLESLVLLPNQLIQGINHASALDNPNLESSVLYHWGNDGVLIIMKGIYDSGSWPKLAILERVVGRLSVGRPSISGLCRSWGSVRDEHWFRIRDYTSSLKRGLKNSQLVGLSWVSTLLEATSIASLRPGATWAYLLTRQQRRNSRPWALKQAKTPHDLGSS